MVTAIFVPISFPMPTCLIHAAFDSWRIVKKTKLILKRFHTRILDCISSHMHSTHSLKCTCGLWDVKQMIFVHDYLKLMDKIWPLSALHLHHRRTSTNDRLRQVTHCLHCTTILLSISIHSNSIQLTIGSNSINMYYKH